MQNDERGSLFTLIQTLRGVWLGLLSAVFLFTLFMAGQQMLQPVTTTNGIFVALSENRPADQPATYTLTIRTNETDETVLNLRNNGRILSYFLSLSQAPTQPITLEHQQGTAVSLKTADTTLQENPSPTLTLVVALLAGLLALPLLRLKV